MFGEIIARVNDLSGADTTDANDAGKPPAEGRMEPSKIAFVGG